MDVKDFFLGILKREVKEFVIYTTNRCNSRCKTCNIWRMQPKIDIKLDIIDKLLKNLDKKIIFGITGGEFLLHPRYKDILQEFDGYEYILFSNGILTDRLIDTVREFNVKEISVSCDGIGKRYKEVRGVDNFHNIKKIVEELRNKTKVVLNYTISPFNSKKDLIEVINFCNKEKVKLFVGLYNRPEYFLTKINFKKAYNLSNIKVKTGCLLFSKLFTNMYIHLYNNWLKDGYKIPCLNIRGHTVIYPNGDVCLCEGKQTVLGNLNKSTFSEIWSSKSTIRILQQNRKCNDCFMVCQRPMDIVLDILKINRLIK
jgi:MoaA/NifB/PqqE/SkfB family radical SAM enzyme